MENKTQDLRVEKTLDIIKRTFEEMIMEMDYEKITVKDLCERGRINRKTFYRYYPALDDLLYELQMEIAKEYIERIKHFKFPQDQDKLTREFFLYNSTQSPVCEKITCSGSYQYIRNRMVRHVNEHTVELSEPYKKLSVEKQNLLIRYVNVSTIELYRQWVTDGKKIPLEEMITLATQFICQGVFGFSANHIMF